jgi:hypothetical protein
LKSKNIKSNRESKENKELKKPARNISKFRLRGKNNMSNMLLKESKDLNCSEKSKKKLD